MCKNCPKKVGGSAKGTKKVSVFGPGTDVKLRYLGDSKELLEYEGPATRKGYVVGGRINLVTVDSRDLATGISWAPGLLEMTDPAGAKLFEFHRPLKEEVEAERKAREMEAQAWADAEALALPPEEPKPKRRKAKAEEPDGESSLPGD
jgi:hypothetical protein